MQAGRLAYELADELRLHRVEVHWSGTKKKGSFGGWRVEWTDGPTVAHMRTAVRGRAKRFPAVVVMELGYDRCHTALAEAIALLLYVDRERDWAYCIESLLWSAFDAIDWPERVDQVWHSRAHALLRHTPDPDVAVVTTYAVHALASTARHGWETALAWLDRLAAEHAAIAEDSTVIDLANRRAVRNGVIRHDRRNRA
jgi:hypothetical protein